MPHAVTCRALGLSQSWFYKWRDRKPTARQQRRAELAVKVREIFDASGGTYGSPRVTLDLHAAGWQVGGNTVAALMAELGLAGVASPSRANVQWRRTGSIASSVHPRRTFCGAAT